MLRTILKRVIPQQLIDYKREIDLNKVKINWEKNGKPLPVPHIIKQIAIREYIERGDYPIFIETGTFAGDMVYAMKNLFERIYSVELDENLHENARKKFEKYRFIEILKGDSAEILPQILKNINKPCLFWLDGHFSGGITAKSDIATPIMKEVYYVFEHSRKHNISHIILIDDARCFDGTGDYPKLHDFKDHVLNLFTDYSFSVENDIIRIVK